MFRGAVQKIRHLQAMGYRPAVVWMSEQPLAVGKQYWCKQTTRRTSCEIRAVRHAIDVNSQREHPAQTLRLNELGFCRVAFHDPLVVDDFRRGGSRQNAGGSGKHLLLLLRDDDRGGRIGSPSALLAARDLSHSPTETRPLRLAH